MSLFPPNFLNELFRREAANKGQESSPHLSSGLSPIYYFEKLAHGDRKRVAKDIDTVEKAVTSPRAFVKLHNRHATRSNLYWIQKDFDEIAEKAIELHHAYPSSRFVGVGHSPYYLIYALDRLALQTGQDIPTVYVPFSGRYLNGPKDRKNNGEAYQYTIQHDYPWDGRNIQQYSLIQRQTPLYRAVLENFDLSPKKIVSDWKENARQTTLVDNVQSGTGYASFIHFMHNWAEDEGIDKDDFSTALQCVALVSKRDGRSVESSRIIEIPEVGFSRPIAVISISEDLRGSLNSNVISGADRPFSEYNAYFWDFQPDHTINYSTQGIVKVIMAGIGAAINNKVAKEHHPYLPKSVSAFLAKLTPAGLGRH